ncbi:MAG: DUF1801 domain-containing protein [Archangium sp.]|nr:DUF1801 domain-containing protein [Archangium sp.]
MANARSKKKAKSGSKSKAKKPAAKKKVVARAAAKKPKVKAKAKKAPAKAKAKASKPAPKAAKAKPTTGPRLPRVLAPEVSNALAQAEVEGLISRLPPPVQPVVKMLRKVVLEVAPEASEQIENGAPAYFANGVFARIEPGEHDVLVRFLKGGKLPSASELPGDGDARVITFQDADALKETVLRKVVREAVMLNLSDSASTPTAEA